MARAVLRDALPRSSTLAKKQRFDGRKPLIPRRVRLFFEEGLKGQPRPATSLPPAKTARGPCGHSSEKVRLSTCLSLPPHDKGSNLGDASMRPGVEPYFFGQNPHSAEGVCGWIPRWDQTFQGQLNRTQLECEAKGVVLSRRSPKYAEMPRPSTHSRPLFPENSPNPTDRL